MISTAIIITLIAPITAATLIAMAVVLKNDLPRTGRLIVIQGYRTRKIRVDTSLTEFQEAEKRRETNHVTD